VRGSKKRLISAEDGGVRKSWDRLTNSRVRELGVNETLDLEIVLDKENGVCFFWVNLKDHSSTKRKKEETSSSSRGIREKWGRKGFIGNGGKGQRKNRRAHLQGAFIFRRRGGRSYL